MVRGSRAAALVLAILATPVMAREATVVPLGTWRDVSDPQRLVRIDDMRLARSEDGRLVEILRIARIENGRVVLDQPLWPRSISFTLRGRRLTVLDDRVGQPVGYKRVHDAPDLLAVTPILLPAPTAISAERAREITEELARRFRLDQEVRHAPPPEPDGVTRVDADNVAWLTKTLLDVGWIDPDRFGEPSTQATLTIIQHSLDFALMAGALSWMESQASLGPRIERWHALVRDRFELMRGERQLHGTQFRPSDDGRTNLFPVQSIDYADWYWKQHGLPGGLADYLGVTDLSEVVVLDYARQRSARGSGLQLREEPLP